MTPLPSPCAEIEHSLPCCHMAFNTAPDLFDPHVLSAASWPDFAQAFDPVLFPNIRLMDIIKKHHSLAAGSFLVWKSITKTISIRKVMMIYHGSPHEVQTEMSRGPLAEDDHGREEITGGGAAECRPAPVISFLLCSSSVRGPLDISVCIFIRRSRVSHVYFSHVGHFW